MMAAFREAEVGLLHGEVPVGCVIVHEGNVIASSCNRMIRDSDRFAHAEMVAMRSASQMFNHGYLSECDMYVTMEPCPMCFHAIMLSRVRRVYFGAFSSRVFQGSSFYYPHPVEFYGGIMELACSSIITSFFKDHRV